MGVVNYEGVEIPDKQVKAFRKAVKTCWDETLVKKPKQWNKCLLKITEGRKSQYKNGKRTFFYSWCGDWVSSTLYEAGCRHKCLNRVEVNGKWRSGHNLTMPMAWAGYKGWLPKFLKKMFANDPSAGQSWHEWDNKKDVCKDGYVPQVGDLVICPRKNGNHIEFWVGFNKKDNKLLVVSAGAQAGGIAKIRERDLDIENLVGVIDISGLAPSSPY